LSKLDVTSFALAWSVLTEKQSKSLLSQLDSFLSGNSKRTPEFSSYPKSSPSVLNVSKKRSSKKKKKKKHQQIPEVKSGPRLSLDSAWIIDLEAGRLKYVR
jgi:hypothetical protein